LYGASLLSPIAIFFFFGVWCGFVVSAISSAGIWLRIWERSSQTKFSVSVSEPLLGITKGATVLSYPQKMGDNYRSLIQVHTGEKKEKS